MPDFDVIEAATSTLPPPINQWSPAARTETSWAPSSGVTICLQLGAERAAVRSDALQTSPEPLTTIAPVREIVHEYQARAGAGSSTASVKSPVLDAYTPRPQP